MSQKNIRVDPKNIYWLDANKIDNYLNNPLTKKRPFICVEIKKINNIKYYYLISGTTQNFKERKFKQFSNNFFEIKKNIIFNDLNEITYFQSNTIYIISEKNIDIFFIRHSGEIAENDKKIITKYINKSYDDKLIIFSIYSEKYNKWFILKYQNNFIYQASCSKKWKAEIKKKILINVKKDKAFTKVLYGEYIDRIADFSIFKKK